MKKLVLMLVCGMFAILAIGCNKEDDTSKETVSTKSEQVVTDETVVLTKTDQAVTDETVDPKDDKADVIEDIDYYANYSALLDSYNEQYDKMASYAVYDLDKDGVKELIISYGTCDADWYNDVYTVSAGATKIGKFEFPVLLYVAEDDNGLYAVSGKMSVQNIDHITKNGDKIEINNIMNDEIEIGEEYYSNDKPIRLVSVLDKSLLQ